MVKFHMFVIHVDPTQMATEAHTSQEMKTEVCLRLTLSDIHTWLHRNVMSNNIYIFFYFTLPDITGRIL